MNVSIGDPALRHDLLLTLASLSGMYVYICMVLGIVIYVLCIRTGMIYESNRYGVHHEDKCFGFVNVDLCTAFLTMYLWVNMCIFQRYFGWWYKYYKPNIKLTPLIYYAIYVYMFIIK